MPTEIKAQNTTTLASVKAIYDAADQANTLLDGMQTAATAAGTTLDGIYQDAADAQTAADDAQASADNASEYAARALGNLSTVQNITETLNWITAHGTMTLTSDVALDPTHVYFVVDAGGDYVVGGTHYSVVTEPDVDDISTYYELSINESLNNYVATHLAVDTEGLWIIPDAGGNKVLIAVGGAGHTYTTAGTYIVGKVGGVDTVLAEFTASGAVIGDAAGAHTSIDEDGMQIYSVDSLDNVINLANIGYGQGTDDDGNISYAPYYTLGRRIPGSVTGNYSVAEGYFSRADGYASHAEGSSNVSTDGFCGHSEGSTTNVLASCGHAEGISSTVRGDYAHAQNNGTYADRRSHTVIGEYNVRDQSGANGTVRGDYAVIVGNGTADNARSNALTIDWSGNVNIASGAKYKINGTNLSASDVGALAEDANGDISITRNITAGGNVEAAGDVTDGAGNVLSSIAAHAVISTGSTGNWNYKKYADGTFEATRFSTNGATGAMTQLGSSGIYYSSAAEITFPSIGITSIRSCLASVMPSSNYLMSYYMSRLTTAHVYFSYIRYGSGSAVTDISYEIAITGTYS